MPDFDPSPLFAFSLFPYLIFLYYLGKRRLLPALSRRGFQLTLLFVGITIAAAVIAELRFGDRTGGRRCTAWRSRGVYHAQQRRDRGWTAWVSKSTAMNNFYKS